MAYAIQCCTRCGKLEQGHTGPADAYVCTKCYKAEQRAMEQRIRERLKTLPPIGPYKA